MNLQLHPELLDRLAASYALGSLRGPARRRFESIAREHPSVRAATLIWQSRLASITELQPRSEPAPAVWTRIDNLVRAEREHTAMKGAREVAVAIKAGSWTGWMRSIMLWRTTTAIGALAAVMAITVSLGMRTELGAEIARLQTQLQAAPQIEYVAVLADGDSAASMLVTFEPKSSKLTLQRVGPYREAGDRSLQLWALPPTGGPRSLGVLGQDKVLRLTAGESDVREVPTLAISLEPKGGVPSTTGPTGPVLFKGSLIRKMM